MKIDLNRTSDIPLSRQIYQLLANFYHRDAELVHSQHQAQY